MISFTELCTKRSNICTYCFHQITSNSILFEETGNTDEIDIKQLDYLLQFSEKKVPEVKHQVYLNPNDFPVEQVKVKQGMPMEITHDQRKFDVRVCRHCHFPLDTSFQEKKQLNIAVIGNQKRIYNQTIKQLLAFYFKQNDSYFSVNNWQQNDRTLHAGTFDGQINYRFESTRAVVHLSYFMVAVEDQSNLKIRELLRRQVESADGFVLFIGSTENSYISESENIEWLNQVNHFLISETKKRKVTVPTAVISSVKNGEADEEVTLELLKENQPLVVNNLNTMLTDFHFFNADITKSLNWLVDKIIV